jgi:hypothetical protein
MSLIEEKFIDLNKVDRLTELIGYNWIGVAIPEGLI